MFLAPSATSHTCTRSLQRSPKQLPANHQKGKQLHSIYTSQSKLRSNSNKRLLLLGVRLGGGGQEVFHLAMSKMITNMKLQHCITLKSYPYSRPVALWTFKAENSLLWENVLCIVGCLAAICGLYPLDKCSIPQSEQSKMSLDILPPGTK